jgi:hypothetical protein
VELDIPAGELARCVVTVRQRDGEGIVPAGLAVVGDVDLVGAGNAVDLGGALDVPRRSSAP